MREVGLPWLANWYVGHKERRARRKHRARRGRKGWAAVRHVRALIRATLRLQPKDGARVGPTPGVVPAAAGAEGLPPGTARPRPLTAGHFDRFIRERRGKRQSLKDTVYSAHVADVAYQQVR